MAKNIKMSIKPKQKTCSSCGNLDFIFSKGRCKNCAQKAYNQKSQENSRLKQKSLSKKPTERHKEKKSAEREAMNQFWDSKADELGRCYCQECLLIGRSREESSLGDEMNPFNVAHIISKGANPKYQADTRNFLLLCANHHQQFDAQFEGKTRQDMKVFALSEAMRLFLRKDDKI
jgi:predicted restriction endonuclease